MLTTMLLGPKYLYMPDLPAWLHWGIYVGLVGALGLALGLLGRKLRRLTITPAQLTKGVLKAVREHPAEVSAALFGEVAGQS